MTMSLSTWAVMRRSLVSAISSLVEFVPTSVDARRIGAPPSPGPARLHAGAPARYRGDHAPRGPPARGGPGGALGGGQHAQALDPDGAADLALDDGALGRGGSGQGGGPAGLVAAVERRLGGTRAPVEQAGIG